MISEDVEMDAEERAEMLALADRDQLVALAEACLAEHGDPVVLVPPEVGLVVLQVREPVCEERFHLGEVVVTRAEVTMGGARGWAMRMGTDRVAALAAAVCDAVATTGGALADEVVAICASTRRTRATVERDQWRELRRTEVHFQELD